MRNRPLRKLIEGSPTIVIANGHILADNMHKIRYDLDELNGQLRQNGVLDPSEVQYAVLETSGDLSVIKKSDYQPVTKTDMGMQLPDPTFPVELIMDGQVIDRNLRKQNKSRAWLDEQLAAQGITDANQVTYAVIDSNGKLFVSPKTREE